MHGYIFDVSNYQKNNFFRDTWEILGCAKKHTHRNSMSLLIFKQTFPRMGIQNKISGNGSFLAPPDILIVGQYFL